MNRGREVRKKSTGCAPKVMTVSLTELGFCKNIWSTPLASFAYTTHDKRF